MYLYRVHTTLQKPVATRARKNARASRDTIRHKKTAACAEVIRKVFHGDTSSVKIHQIGIEEHDDSGENVTIVDLTECTDYDELVVESSADEKVDVIDLTDDDEN